VSGPDQSLNFPPERERFLRRKKTSAISAHRPAATSKSTGRQGDYRHHSWMTEAAKYTMGDILHPCAAEHTIKDACCTLFSACLQGANTLRRNAALKRITSYIVIYAIRFS